MFLCPLIGGVGVFGAMRMLRLRPLPRFSINAYNSGIATLTVGSTLQGVFEIAGTSSPYEMVFAVVGIAFLIAALGGVIRRWLQEH